MSDRPRIALIGIGCRFPGGAHGPEGTWRVLAEGRDPVREVPADRWDVDAWHDPDPEAPGKTITREGAFLDDVARFDAARFGISPREALQMDPQQRLLLEVAWEGLEDAGIAPDSLGGTRTGVYIGMGISDYARRSFLGPDADKIDAYAGTGTFSSVAAGRVAYALGLRGPALAIHTACSSSLVAIHLAVEALRNGSVDLAIAGGVNLLLAPEPSVYFSKLGALSTDGRCRTFDAEASGYGRGEGCGVVVLRRLPDASGDRVHAVVRGSAINQDGRSNGLTAPSGSAQQDVIRAALADAGLQPEEIGLIEAHGTGTPLGDPIEAAALAAVYGAGSRPCLLRSVKTSFGHTEAAAGVAGTIAAALSLAHDQIPPHLHLQTLNPRIDLGGTRLSIPTTLTPFVGPRRAAISAFGLAGTNAHLILEAPPDDDVMPTLLPGRPELLVISATTARGLDKLRPQYAATLRSARLENVCWSAATGRALMPHRLAIVATDSADAAGQLAAGEGHRAKAGRPEPVVFAYTGQGSQWHGMGRDLYAAEAVFRDAFDRVDALFRPHRDGTSLVEVLYGDDTKAVHDTTWTQPALFAVGLALTELWASWGLRPDAVIGHSIGEITAATVAGLFGLDDAVALVAERARLMGELPEGGTMAAVRAALEPVKAAIAGLPDLGIAGVNSPNDTVISGTKASVDAAIERLNERGLDTIALRVSHAFHSPLVEPMLDAFEKTAKGIAYRTPTLPIYSNVTGKLAGSEIQTATYWREHVRRPVRFAHGLQAASSDGYRRFVEIGPHPVLSSLGMRTLDRSEWFPSLVRLRDGRSAMLDALGQLIVRGFTPDAAAVWNQERPFKVDLPLTPPDGERYWLEPLNVAPKGVPAWGLEWVEVPNKGRVQGRWWVDGAPDGVALVCAGLAEAGGDAQRGLPDTLSAGDTVVWVVPSADGAANAWAAGPERLRVLWTRIRRAGARLWVVTRGAVAARSGERPDAGAAMCWGLGRVLALEDPEAFAGLVDLSAGPVGTEAIGQAFATGEDQIAVRERLWAPRLVPVDRPETQVLDIRGSWLITGGFGALGSAVARWLVGGGVTRLVLASRSGANTPEREALVAELRDEGATVAVEQIDLGDRASVVDLVDRCNELVGVIHCAGAVDLGTVEAQDEDRFRTGFEAKVLGAEALHLATRALKLRAFVLFSSVAATWGSARLGAYAAENAWLDTIAQRREATGLPGVSLAWGPWADGGMVGAEDRRQFARMGVRALPVRSALDALGAHLHERGHRVLADVDWATFAPIFAARRPRPLLERLAPRPAPPSLRPTTLPPRRRSEGLREVISADVRAVLGLSPRSPLDPGTGFFDLGMDSLMAVQLQRRLRDSLGMELPATIAFDYPSVDAMVRFVDAEVGTTSDTTADLSRPSGGPIAIVGWSARFPGAPDVDAFEALLFRQQSAIGPAPARAGVGQGGFLDAIEDFDAGFFGMGPAEATALDPQQRLLLEGSVQALEHAGIATDRLAEEPVGVFVGIGRSAYWDRLRDPTSELWPWSGVGNEQSFAAGRIAYALGVRGPTLAVNTACSSSLVAVHLAVQALREGSCSMALAGGVNVLLSASDDAWLQEIGALSPSGACHTFDAAADGYVRAEGCGVLVLEPLEFAQAAGRTILGVIRGSAVGHGGAAGGLTVPNGPAQAEVIQAALDDADARPEEVSYVECHGTGTPLGDPIELGALRQVFRRRSEPLVLGAAKATVGHSETAAGVVGLIAAALVLRRGEAPASPELHTPNPRLPVDWPVHLPTERHPVHGLAGVSSFGISGTNAHVILEAATDPDPSTLRGPGAWPIVVSAHSEAALDAQVAALIEALPDGASGLSAVARTLATGRSARAYRTWVVAGSLTEAKKRLRGEQGHRGTAIAGPAVRQGWLFTGQGLSPGVGLDLVRLPAFRRSLDRAGRALGPHLETPLHSLLASPPEGARAAEPAVFALQWALANTLGEMGAQPTALLGLGVGEWAAAVVGGVLDLDDAAAIVGARGRGGDALREALSRVALTAPTVPMYSSVDGEELGLRATDPSYWLAQAASGSATTGLANLEALTDVRVELGPVRTLPAADALHLLDGPVGEIPTALHAIGALWVRGGIGRIDVLVETRAPIVALPSVAWQRQRLWVEDTTPATVIAPLYRLEFEPSTIEGSPLAGRTPTDLLAAVLRIPVDGDHILALPGVLSSEGPAGAASAIGWIATANAERRSGQLRWVDPDAGEPRWVRWNGPASTPTGTWAVTGASGALGGRLVRWLVDQGVSVVACARGEAPADLPEVHWVSADVGTDEGVTALLAAGPFDGVIHAAGANSGAWLRSIDADNLGQALHGKAGGAQRLADALPESTRLVLFGSATAWLGLAGQGSYAAANGVLEGIAARRPATSCIAWGPWEAGMAAQSAVDWTAYGVRPLSDRRALDALSRAMAPDAPVHLAAIDLDAAAYQAARGAHPLLARLASAPQLTVPALVHELAGLGPTSRVHRLEVLVREQAAAVLGHDVIAGGGFFEQGLDSLGAVELARRVGTALGLSLPATTAFDHPTPALLAEALASKIAPAAPVEVEVVPRTAGQSDEDIAVIGLACRFPGADDADALWELLVGGRSAIREVPSSRWDLDDWFDPDPSASGKMYTRHGGFLDGIDQFDPELFGISPREATSLDPQQRLLLETAWRALDDAATLDRANGSRTGVFVGIAERGWLRRFEDGPYYRDAWSGTGSESSFAAGRVSHALGLRGPAIALNTTCSSSLVALHLAADALRRGDCDQALAGGVHLVLDPESTVYLCQLGALSPSGRCHTFDAAADGYVRGEGCGLLVLKRLSDAQRDGDRIRAVLRGSAVNHDGHASGLTVPSGPAQTDVIQRALADAALGPDDIDWLQAHGTGTPLGDPIELAAAARVFGGRAEPLAVGTVKTALGHCELAAGAAGAIAAVLALEHGTLPPHPLETANPELDLTGWDLPAEARAWPSIDRPRRVGVSAFGLSGTNAHVIFEAGPAVAAVEPDLPMLVPAAAHSEAALSALHLGSSPAQWAGLGRRAAMPLRLAVVRSSAGEILLDGPPTRAGRAPRVAFLFTGQGSQWAGMHRALAGEPAYDAVLEQALAAFAEADPALAELGSILDDEDRLGRTEFTQPALFAVEVATAAWWQSVGIEPVAVVGHSIGELSAACIAGGLTLEDGARLVAARGRLMGSLPRGAAMFVAHTGAATLGAHVADGVEITGVNDPEETALAGPEEAVEATIASLEAAGIAITRLNVSHAFHTAAMDPILDDFEAVAATISWTRPTIPLVSTLRGVEVDDEPGMARYWRDHARHAVRFADAMRSLEALGIDALVECGPHPILVRMGQRTLGPGDKLWLGTHRRGSADRAEALRAAGKLWERGAPVRLDVLSPRSTAPIPAYPMQRRRLWPEGDRHAVPGGTYALDWTRIEPRKASCARWIVAGDGSVAKALRAELSAGDSVDDLRAGDGLILVCPRKAGTVRERIDAAREIAVKAHAVGAQVWWVTRGGLRTDPDPDAEAVWAWVRAVFAEHPELAGGLVDLEPAARSAHATAELLLSVLGHREAAIADGALYTRTLVPRGASAPEAAIGGTWLLTGGLGVLGLQVAGWLAGRGATKLILTARTPLADGPRADAVAQLRERVDVDVVAADVADLAVMAGIFAEPISGVVHLAGHTDPQPVLSADPERAAALFHGKVDGARVLDGLTREHGTDHFVLFGSIAAAWGSRELADYGAANAWLGALARSRRAAGLPALCIHWGPWAGGGMVDEDRAERLARMGQQLLRPTAALRVLGAALGTDEPEWVAARVDWPRFLTLVEATGPLARFDAVRPASMASAVAVPDAPTVPLAERAADWLPTTIARRAAEVLRLEPGTVLDPERPLMELGFDSLMATELNNALLADGIHVPLGRLLGGPSLEELAIMAEANTTDELDAPAVPVVEQASSEAPLFWTHLAALIVGSALASAAWWAFG